MTVLIGLLKGLACCALLSGLAAGVDGIYHAVTGTEFAVIVGTGVPAMIAAGLAVLVAIDRRRTRREGTPRGRHAAPPVKRNPRLAEAQTMTLPAAPEPHEPTVPVVIAAPDTLYPDWPTGQFAAITGQQGGAA